jgi:hypothetical protein
VTRWGGLRASPERYRRILAPGRNWIDLRNFSSSVPSKPSEERLGTKETKLKNRDARNEPIQMRMRLRSAVLRMPRSTQETRIVDDS